MLLCRRLCWCIGMRVNSSTGVWRNSRNPREQECGRSGDGREGYRRIWRPLIRNLPYQVFRLGRVRKPNKSLQRQTSCVSNRERAIAKHPGCPLPMVGSPVGLVSIAGGCMQGSEPSALTGLAEEKPEHGGNWRSILHREIVDPRSIRNEFVGSI
ncbi:hypothetical protein M405DRAFT_79861 [Rhizopogon salebrosus TDB-379]|nr:hypothetical protein M405DRAFT_79861 [Rhizopogon salebrosus TDB-379]